MTRRPPRGALAAIFLLLCLLIRGANAQQFSNIYVFGDSLSDTGRIYEASRGIFPPDPPYFDGRFSNGPVWVEYLAERLNLSLSPSDANDLTNIDGNNMAAGGARAGADTRTILGTIPSVLSQLESFLGFGPQPAPEDALYVVHAGTGDLLWALDPQNGFTAEEQLQVVSEATTSLGEVLSALGTSGAKQIFLANVADVGDTPRTGPNEWNVSAQAHELVSAFNHQLDSVVGNLSLPDDVRFTYFDLYGLGKEIFDDAANDNGVEFGILNVEVPVFPGFAGSMGENSRISLFADDVHPTTLAHFIFADAAFKAISVPEPCTIWLSLIGFFAVTIASQRQPKRFGKNRKRANRTCAASAR